MEDEKLQHKKWIKITLIAFAILVILLVAYRVVKGPKIFEEDITQAMGVDEMSKQERASVKKEEGILDIQHWNLDNGARVYFVEAPNLPMVDIQLTFDAGSARDPKGKEGLAFLTNTLLAEGTETIDHDTVAETFEALGVEYHFDAKRDMATAAMRSLSDKDKLAQAMSLFSEIVAKPSFAEKGVNREKSQGLTLLQYESQLPKYITQKAFYESLYPEHAYANWVHGNEKGIEGITQADLKKFHEQFYVAQNVSVAIVGDVTVKEAHALASKVTEHLAKGEKAPDLPQVKAIEAMVEKSITFPSEQTHIMMGAPGITREDPDYYALYVGNHILGGNGMVTRVFDEIREKRGLAYDARSYFIPMRVPGPYIFGLQTQGEKKDEAITVLKDTVAKFVQEGPTEEELAAAKKNLLGGYALRFDSNGAILAHLAVIGFYDLPLDFYDNFKGEVEKIDLAAVKDAYQRRVHPDKMVVVTVGS